MNSEKFTFQLVNSVPDEYLYKNNLPEINHFFKNNILNVLLDKLEMNNRINLAVVPVYSFDPFVIKLAEEEPVIIFDHILMVIMQFYFRSLVISANLKINGNNSGDLYITKIYSVIIKIFNDKDNLEKTVNEIISIEEQFDIDGTFDENNKLLYTGLCMAFEQFLIARELISIRNIKSSHCNFKKYEYYKNELDVYQLSSGEIISADIEGVKWYDLNRKYPGLRMGLNETMSTTAYLSFYTIKELLEKNLTPFNGIHDYPSSKNRLEAILNSLSIFKNHKLRGILKREIELVKTLPDNNYISLMETLYGAIFK